MAAVFNNTNGVDLGTPAGLNITDPFTMFAWVYPTTIQQGTIFRLGESGSSPYVREGMALNPDGTIEMEYASGGVLHQLVSGTVRVVNTWYAVAIRLDSSAGGRQFINGSLDASLTYSPIDAMAVNGMIGYSQNFGEHFAGRIAHVAVWNSSLTDAQVIALSNIAGSTVPSTVAAGNLKGYWPLTSDLSDGSGHGLNGSAVGPVGFAAGPFSTPDTTAPSVPTNLHTTAVGTTTASLAWNASTDDTAVTGYEVTVSSP